MNASGDRVALIFMAPKAGKIDRVSFRTGTSHVLNGASVVRFSLQDTTITGNVRHPDGTQDQFRDHDNTLLTGINVTVNTGLITDDGTDTGTKRTVALGDIIAVVVEYQTFTAGDSIATRVVDGAVNTGWSGINNFSALSEFQGSTWSTFQDEWPIISIEYETDGWTQVHPYNSPAHTDGESPNSANNERGSVIQVPFRCEVVGIMASFMETDAVGTLKVYNASETEIAAGHDTTRAAGTATDSVTIMLDTRLTLEAATNYYFVWRGNVNVGQLTTVASAIYKPVLLAGTTWKWVQRTDFTTDSFTEIDNLVHPFSLIISGVETPAGGGSSLVPLTGFGGLN